MRIILVVDYNDDSREDKGAAARALRDVVAEQEGVTGASLHTLESFTALCAIVHQLFPRATIEEGDYGELLICTDMRDENDRLVPLFEPE